MKQEFSPYFFAIKVQKNLPASRIGGEISLDTNYSLGRYQTQCWAFSSLLPVEDLIFFFSGFFCINFIDYEKAFDSLERNVLWDVIAHYVIPSKIVSLEHTRGNKLLYSS